MKRFVPRGRTWGWLLVAVVGTVIYLPSLLLPWSLIDDGYDVLVCRILGEALGARDWAALLSSLLEPENSRVRPAYWLGLWLQYGVGGDNPAIHHILRLLTLAIVLGLLGYLAQSLRPGTHAGWVAALLVLLFPGSVENWYRLGPQEPPQVLLLLGAFVSLLQAMRLSAPGLGRPALAWLALALVLVTAGIFTKEPTVAVVVPAGVLWLSTLYRGRTGDRAVAGWFLLGIGAAAVVLLALRVAMARAESGGYGAAYSVEPSLLAASLRAYSRLVLANYGPLLLAAALVASVGVYRWWITGRPTLSEAAVWQLMGLAWFGSFLALQLPWPYILARYMLPPIVGLALSLGLAVGDLPLRRESQEARKREREKARARDVGTLAFSPSRLLASRGRDLFSLALGAIVVAGLALFVAVNSVRAWDFVASYYQREQANGEAVALVAQEAAPVSALFFNMAYGDLTMEWVVEFDLHLRLFHGRADLKTEYLDLESGRRPTPGRDLVLYWSLFPRYSLGQLADALGPGRTEVFRVSRQAPLVPTENAWELAKTMPAAVARALTGGGWEAVFSRPESYEWVGLGP